MAKKKDDKKAKKTMVKKPVTKKKKKVAVLVGIINIHSTSNNTIINLANEKGEVLAFASGGTVGYKGAKKETPFAAGQAATIVANKAKELGIKKVIVKTNGVGQGREMAIRNIDATGLEIIELNDCTPIPHNGCKPPKKKR